MAITIPNARNAQLMATRSIRPFTRGVDAVPPPPPFDASGLTLSNSFSGPTVLPSYLGGTAPNSDQPLVLVARQVVIPEPHVDGTIFTIAAVDGSYFQMDSLYGFAAAVAIGGAVDATATFDASAYAGMTVDIAVEYDTALSSIRVWFGNTLVATATGTFTTWGGVDDGGYLQGDVEEPAGSFGAAWDGTAGDLEVYFNQTVP